MIIGITGAICAGKRTFAEYLAKIYGFDLIDMLELFRLELKKQGITIAMECSPVKGAYGSIKQLDDGNSEDEKEEEEHRENAEEVKRSIFAPIRKGSHSESDVTRESSGASTISEEESFMFQYY